MSINIYYSILVGEYAKKHYIKPFNKKFHPLVEEVLVTTNAAMLSILNKGANETMNNFNKQNIGVA